MIVIVNYYQLIMIKGNLPVPLFVTKCISEIEKGDLLQTDGVYRQSGNLSTVQKIRLQVRHLLTWEFVWSVPRST